MNNSSCVFYNKSFFEDLYPYKILSDNNEFQIQFDLGDRLVDNSLEFQIPELLLSAGSRVVDSHWIPIFSNIEQSNASISNSYLASGFALSSDNLGIESVIKFNPLFRNWDISNGKMVSDWILTSPLYPYLPDYGIMCWAKSTDLRGFMNSGVNIDKIPYNTIVFSEKDWTYVQGTESVKITTKTKLIKKTDDVLLIIDNDKIKKSAAGDILPGTAVKYLILSELIKQYEEQTIKIKKEDILFKTENIKNIIYHISNGEAYSYYENREIKNTSLKYNTPSKTYLSPVLHDLYRQIYNNLTLKLKKHFDKKIPKAIFNQNQGRKFKKICYFLATHPQIDRTTVSTLQHQEIYDLISYYINDANSSTSQNEVGLLLTAISRYFKDLNTDENKYLDPAYLPKKIIEKYGAKLQFNTKSSLSYKTFLPDGPHLKVKSDIRSLGSKDVLEGGELYDNITIKVGPFSAKTILEKSQSTLELSSNLGEEITSVPLWDVAKASIMKDGGKFTAGPDIELDFKNPKGLNNFYSADNPTGEELRIMLKVGLLFDQQVSAFAGVDIGFRWTRIFGSDCLRFGNESITSIRNNGIYSGDMSSLRFEASDDESPYIYIKKSGKYTVLFTITTPFGIKSQAVNLYITDNNYSRPRNEIPRLERIENLISEKSSIIMSHGLKEFAFGKQGIFWPIYSDLSVYEPRYVMTPSVVVGLESKRFIGNFAKPLGSLINKFLFKFDRNTDKAKDISKNIGKHNLVFVFEPSYGVISEISRISLSYLNSSLNPQCEPIYRETFDNRLVDLELDSSKILADPISGKDIEIPRPSEIGTKAISMKTPNLNMFSDVVFADRDESDNFDEFNYTKDIYSRTVDGISNDANPAVCYEVYSQNDELEDVTTFKMNKGYFHPNSGWLPQTKMEEYSGFKNRTSIIIGDGLKRSCKTFRGLGFSEISNNFIDGKVKIYKSSITLSTDKKAFDPPSDVELGEKISKEREEVDDHDSNHGYRDLSRTITSLYKYNDEFLVEPSTVPDGPVENGEYCDVKIDENISTESFIIGENTSIKYAYPKPGPIKAPKDEETRDFRFDREIGRSIGDLEIKLNYLNYINPKELVIWLTIDAPASISMPLSNPKIRKHRDPYFFSKPRKTRLDQINSISNTNIKDYALSLLKLNDNPYLETEQTIQENETDEEINEEQSPTIDNSVSYYLYLLNQDHIDMPLYNNTIKFTDNVSDNNNNLNIGEFITANTSQATLKNGIVEVKPTLSAPGYSDEEINKYKAILASNQITPYVPCSFNKFKNMPLFTPNVDVEDINTPPKNISSITFTLNIAVIGESDSGEIYDRVLSTDNMMNINSFKTKNISSILTSSLCSWEILLSNHKSLTNFEDKDAFGQIDYQSQEPKYEGYNFIGKISPDIIPPINRDAPNKSIYDNGKCYYSREKLTAPKIDPVPLLNINPIIYIPSFTLVGELANAAGLIDQMNNQGRNIYDYLNGLRRIRLAEQFNREIYIPKFTEFPAGRSDKALVSISKDKKIWFKLEAGILRYNNCPIIKRKKYIFKHIHYMNEFRDMCKFTLRSIQNPASLIEYKTKIIKPIKSDFPEYNLTITDIKKYIESDISDNVLLERTKYIIYSLQKSIKDLSASSSEEDVKKSLTLRNILLEYKSLYKQIGPEGIKADDIICFEELTTDPQTNITTTIKSYCVVLYNNSRVSLLFFKNLYTLLNHNKSLFIDNNLNILHKSLQQFEIQQSLSSEEKAESNIDTARTNILSTNGTRAYSIYKTNQTIEIYTPKEALTDADNQSIVATDEEISHVKKLILEETKKNATNKTADETKIYNLKKELLRLENKIFVLTHDMSENIIRAKSIIRDGDSYSTIFVMEKSIKDQSILVIKPSDNRIIAYDNEYIEKENMPNPWTFVNDVVVFNEGVGQDSKNIFNNGTYGTGTISNNRISLYNPETVNYVKDFIDYIDHNRHIDDDFTEDYIISRQNLTGSMSRIYTFGSDSSESLIKKYNSFIKMRPKDTKTYQFEDVLEILDSIMNNNEYNSFFKGKVIKSLIEGSLDNTNVAELEASVSATKFANYIEFINNNKTEIVYSYKNINERDILSDRILKGIPDSIKAKQLAITTKLSEINNIDSELAKANRSSLQSKKLELQKEIENLKKDISKLHLEFNRLYYYFEKLKTNSDNKILGNIEIYIISNSDKTLSINEVSNDNLYILNIDAEQGCSIDYDKLPKILTEITYECLSVVGPYYVDPFRFCPRLDDGVNYLKFGDYILDSRPGMAQYKLSNEKLERFKSDNQHPNLIWANNIRSSQRTFFLNGQDNRGGIVKATYKYLVPEYKPTEYRRPEGLLENKVKDIFNLDNDNQIYINFRRINRNLRNVDSLYYKYVPSVDGALIKSLSPAPGGPIDNTLKVWQCHSSKDGAKLALPKNFKWMNLVKYMSFYNKYLFNKDINIFNLNRGIDTVMTRDEMGLIPYDYK